MARTPTATSVNPYADGRWHRPCRTLVATLAVVVGAGLAGCGTSHSSSSMSSMKPVAQVGSLEIIHPFLPNPPSPSVAAIYLTVRNTGSTPDELVTASTPLTSQAMLMTENGDSMAALTDLVIPAHGEASLTPGKDHLMLENPATTFKVGQQVSVTLRFAKAGQVTLEVPVVPLDDILNDGGMANMPGM